MNRNELVEALSARLEQTRSEAGETLDAVVDEIKKALEKGENVSIPGFGVFETIFRNAQNMRSAKTGEEESVAGDPVAKFSPGADLKAMISGARQAVLDRTKKATPAKESAQEVVEEKAAKVQESAAKSTTKVKKSAAKKSATAKKATAEKASTVKKSAAKKTATAKKPTSKKSATAKKPTPKKASTVKKPAVKKPAVKKPAVKKPAVKKPAAKKTATAKKATSKKSATAKKKATAEKTTDK